MRCDFKLIYLYIFLVVVFWLLVTLFVELRPLCQILKLHMKFYLAIFLALLTCGFSGAYVMLTIIIQNGAKFLVGVENIFLLITLTLKIKRIENYMILRLGINLFLEMSIFIYMNPISSSFHFPCTYRCPKHCRPFLS